MLNLIKVVTVYYHEKDSINGWTLKEFHDSDSNKWTDWQLQWIDELLHRGHMVLTIGDAMFSLKRG
jgi:hypothetical protein